VLGDGFRSRDGAKENDGRRRRRQLSWGSGGMRVRPVASVISLPLFNAAFLQLVRRPCNNQECTPRKGMLSSSSMNGFLESE
jgi:hypothetical protein